MRAPVLLPAGAVGLLALVVGVAPPAAADPSGATAATVTSGAPAVTVPTDAGNLGTRADTVGGQTISGPLGQVQVSDARSAPAGSGWVASVVSTAFTSPTGQAIPAAVSYTAGPVTRTGTPTDTADDPGDLTGVSAAVTATGITGDNSATWNPTITVHLPGGTAAGTYSATITHSVA